MPSSNSGHDSAASVYPNDNASPHFNELAGKADVLHIDHKRFEELRNAAVPITAELVGKNKTVFAIVVDNPDWTNLADNSGISVKPDCILVDATADDTWILYERLEARVPYVSIPQTHVIAAIWLLRKKKFTGLPSDYFWHYDGADVEQWCPSEADVRKIFSVALGACWLLVHDRVHAIEINLGQDRQHYRLEIEEDLSIVDALTHLRNGSHVRRSMPLLEGFARSLLGAITDKLNARSEKRQTYSRKDEMNNDNYGPALRQLKEALDLTPLEASHLAEGYSDNSLSGPAEFSVGLKRSLSHPALSQKLGAKKMSKFRGEIEQLLREVKSVLVSGGPDALGRYLDSHPVQRYLR